MNPNSHFGFSCTERLPIRRFSQAARVEERHEFVSDDQSSPWDRLQTPPEITVSADSMEEYQFIDSFFNVDQSSREENEMPPFGSVLNNDNPDFDFDFDFDLGLDSFLMPEENTNTSGVPMMTEMDGQDQTDQTNGLQLVHLLLACAEAVSCRDGQLAESILAQIWHSANPLGDSLQRVSYWFAMGLKSRLQLLHANGTVWGGVTIQSIVTNEEKTEAFHLLHRNTPYVEFGFIAANESILEAAKQKERFHIIDIGMQHTLQWCSLIRTLRLRSEVLPKSIRITGILTDLADITELESSMGSVAAEADSLGIELGFRLIAGPATPEMLTSENLTLKENETVFVNSVLHLHTYVKESRSSLKVILRSIKKLGPALLTLVEQDANHNGPFFLGRFLESLHYYSAIFDSLEACLERNSTERMKIERDHFAEEIRNIVAFEGAERVERHERAEQWRRQLGRAGFQVAAGGKERLMTVRECLNSGDGYTIGNDHKGYALLGWKGRPIMFAAAWQPTAPPSSSS